MVFRYTAAEACASRTATAWSRWSLNSFRLMPTPLAPWLTTTPTSLAAMRLFSTSRLLPPLSSTPYRAFPTTELSVTRLPP